MKKILLFTALIITLALNASAQSDGFFKSDNNSEYRTDDMMLPTVPSGSLGTIPDSEVPLGSGLLIMTALGGALVLKKKLKDN